MRNQVRTIAICMVSAVVALPLIAAPASQGSSKKVMATVAGTPITEEQVEAEVAAQLQRIEQQRMEILSRALGQMIDTKLLDMAAAKQKITRAQLLEREIDGKVVAPTAEDVDAFYEENKARIQQPKEQLATQIQQQLIRDQKTALYQQLIQRLGDEFEVTNPFEDARAAAELERAAEVRKLVEAPGHPAKGPAGAPVTIVEFSDFQCPYCSRVLPSMEKIEKEYGDRVRLVFRQFPLSIHKNAFKAAEASLCAEEQGKFWEMHDAMFGDQQKLDVDSLKEKAAKLEMDSAKFDQCLDSGRFAAQVRADIQVGQSAGVSATPSSFVNGVFLRGAQPYDAFKKAVDEALARVGEKGKNQSAASAD